MKISKKGKFQNKTKIKKSVKFRFSLENKNSKKMENFEKKIGKFSNPNFFIKKSRKKISKIEVLRKNKNVACKPCPGGVKIMDDKIKCFNFGVNLY